ncbi:hypothetical protein DES53_102927 [Roseimicrobium gellanilyticum]|uniref:Uncharacterized protein n=1 Tax=Roseimicrobium gellanilyticum TaxID=748857 RepID=A0A366HSQ8_9BACT|nr:hypothetical protein [Roseimicrobium gellanilyticum]RBP46536.1 hypothetical protein DES53_102927 [Roseimicrobium gellanilyticum]
MHNVKPGTLSAAIAGISLLLCGAPLFAGEPPTLTRVALPPKETPAASVYFMLTAPRDREIHVIVDKVAVSGPSKLNGVPVRLPHHKVAELKNGRWKEIRTAQCASPDYVRLKPSQKLVVKVEPPESKLPWRIGIPAYAAAPGPNVAVETVWGPSSAK